LISQGSGYSIQVRWAKCTSYRYQIFSYTKNH